LPIRLTEGLRNGARVLLAQAIEAEVEALLSRQADKLTVANAWCATATCPSASS
jgi:hypothetical protein